MAKSQKPRPTKTPKDRRANATQVTQLLRDDHRRIESYFEDMEETDDLLEKTEIRDFTLAEIRVHKAIVDEVFYPAAADVVGDTLVDEAREELEELEPLLETVQTTSPAESSFEAAWQKLSRQLSHHSQWEEQELLNKAEESEEIDLLQLGLRIAELRKEIMAEQPTSNWESELENSSEKELKDE